MKYTTDWSSLPETILGDFGERLISDELFMNKEVLTYTQDNTHDAPHVIDGVGVFDDGEVFLYDVKTQEKLDLYNGTGINTRNLDKYIKLSKKNNLKFYVFVVDSLLGKIMYGEVNDLVKPYTSDLSYPCTTLAKGKTIVPIDLMKELRPLTDEEIYKLKELKK